VTALALQPLNPIQVLAATWNPTSRQVGVYRIADPAAAPGTVVAPPAPSTSVQPSKPAVINSPHPNPQPVTPRTVNYTNLIAGLAILLELAATIWARRWVHRREDRRTYSP
jgi:hypothetical protein